MMIIDYLHRLMILRLCLLGCVASCSIRHWSRVSCVSLHEVINSGPEIGQNQFSLYLLYFRYVLCQIRQHLHHKANRAPCVILCDFEFLLRNYLRRNNDRILRRYFNLIATFNARWKSHKENLTYNRAKTEEKNSQR